MRYIVTCTWIEDPEQPGSWSDLADADVTPEYTEEYPPTTWENVARVVSDCYTTDNPGGVVKHVDIRIA